MPNEFWAAIAGAVVGGIIAYFIQIRALNAATAAREKDAAERRKSLGFALLIKMIRIYTTLRHMQNHMEECLGKLKEAEHAGWEPWQVMVPIANPAENIHFSTDEMAMLLSLKNDDLFNDLASLDVVHNSFIEIFQTCSRKRAELLERLPAPATMEGLVGSIELSQEQVRNIRSKIVEANDLILSVNDRCAKDSKEAEDVLNRLNIFLNEKLELAVMVTPKDVNAKP